MHHSGERWRLGHRPGLDGLRGVAVLLVVAFHAAPAWFPGGGVAGVVVFFVLSGFLITSLLIEERDRTGAVSLGGFYRRRALRLLPALLMMLAVVGPIALVVGNVTPLDLLAVLGYVGNWWAAAGHGLGMLTHMWTLAAEEQFYLLWPLVLLVIRRRLLAVVVGLAVVLLASRVVFAGSGAGNDVVLYSGADALLAGCALAVWMHRRPSHRAVPAWAGVVLPMAVVGTSWISVSSAVLVVVVTATATATIAVLMRLDRSMLAWNPLRAIGRRSYGLYLWHLPVLGITSQAGLHGWIWTVLALIVTALVTEASWRFVERPFLRLKQQGQATRPHTPDRAAGGGVVEPVV